MSRTYYVIELTPRWLTILLIVLAGLMVLAFVGGYGAAWSVLDGEGAGPTGSPAAVMPTPTIATVEVASRVTPAVTPSVATPVPAKPTVTPPPGLTATATPSPTVTPPPPTQRAVALKPVVTSTDFWVQVLASRHSEAIEKAKTKLADAGFPRESQKVVETSVAGGTTLLKLRIGPFPDRGSADRVMNRMQDAGFPDAWVVKPCPSAGARLPRPCRIGSGAASCGSGRCTESKARCAPEG